MHAATRLLVVMTTLAVAGCSGPTVDLTKGLEVSETRTGWADAGQVNGSNKLVPFVTFKLKNVSDQKLKVLQVNAVFRKLNDPEEWGSSFKYVRGSDGLAPGESTDTIHLRSATGATAAQPRADMLANAHFVDAKVDLYAKYSSLQWIRIAELNVVRQLLTN
jgi:hypothetical protein